MDAAPNPPDTNPFHNPASNAAARPDVYVAALLQVLGTRDPIQVLAATPDAARQAVAGLSREQEARPEKPGKWSARQVIQHLADSEVVGAYRFRMVLAQDSPAITGYDQDLWAERLAYEDIEVATALDDFAMLRQLNLRLLLRAAPADFQRVMRHTERGEESLGLMMSLYAAHDLVHLRQLARIRAALSA